MEKESILCRLSWMTDHTHSTPIPPDSAPMTSSANKESKTRKDSVFSQLKSNNPNTDFMSFVYLVISAHQFLPNFLPFFISSLSGKSYKSYNQFCILTYQIKNKTMNQHIHAPYRDISSSEDHCRCEACRNQDELKNFQRQNPTNIYMNKHLKKRGVPPVKKQLFNKDMSRKAKYMTKKEQLKQKLESEKTPATPIKHKLLEALRSKQAPSSSYFVDYHQVSHSQRQKLPTSKDVGSNKIEEHRRLSNVDEFKVGPLNKQLKPKTGTTKLVQISENPENIRLRPHNSSSLSQASANHNDKQQQNSVKSLQKAKE